MLRFHRNPHESGDTHEQHGTWPALLSGSFLLNAVAPFLAYQVLSYLGVATLQALAATAIFPLVGLALGWARNRRLDGIGLLSLVLLAIGLTTSLLAGDPRLYLIQGPFGNAAFGAVCIASLGLRRPLLFYLGRQLSSGDDRARQAAYDASWSSSGFRRALRVLTAAWGLAYLAEAGIRGLLVWTLPPQTVLLASPVLGYGVLALLIVWTMAYAGDALGCGSGTQRSRPQGPASPR